MWSAFRKSTSPGRAAARRQARPGHCLFEPLEPRQYLSAGPTVPSGGGNLTPSVTQVKLPSIFVPFDTGTVEVALNNSGPGTAAGVLKISAFISTDQTLSDDDLPLATPTFNHVSVHVAAGKTAQVTGKFTVPADIPPGNYFILVDLSVVSGFAGGTVSTAAVVSATSAQAQWSFGSVGTRKNVALVYVAPDGTKETFKLSTGTGALSQDAQGNLSVGVTGTTSASAFSEAVSGGAGVATLTNFNAAASLGSISAPQVNLAGVLTIAGNVKSMLVDNIAAGFSGGITGGLTSLTTNGNFTGNLGVATGIGTILVKGNLSAAQIVAGVNVGPDGIFGTSDDTYAAGNITTLHVLGTISTSFIGAGVDPGDGIFGNGNDVSAGASVIKTIIANVGADQATIFECSAFGTARLPNAVDIANDDRFIFL